MNPDPTALPNAVEQTAFLPDYGNTLLAGFWAAVGASLNILLYVAGGKPLNKPLAIATVISGVALGITSSTLIGSMLGLSISQSMGVGTCALFTGMLGITITKKVVGLDINLPFGSKDASK